MGAWRPPAAVGDPSYRTIKGILVAGTETEAEPETGDAGAAAFVHGPEALFGTAIPAQTSNTRHDDQEHGDELGHFDFLQILCQDEITRREAVAFERRLRRAKFEQQVTLEGFDFHASPKLPAAQIRDLAAR